MPCAPSVAVKQHSPDLPNPTVLVPERLRVLRLRRCWVAHSPIGLNGKTNYAGMSASLREILEAKKQEKSRLTKNMTNSKIFR